MRKKNNHRNICPRLNFVDIRPVRVQVQTDTSRVIRQSPYLLATAITVCMKNTSQRFQVSSHSWNLVFCIPWIKSVNIFFSQSRISQSVKWIGYWLHDRIRFPMWVRIFTSTNTFAPDPPVVQGTFPDVSATSA